MTEVWRAVPNYEGIYEISNQGRVRSLDREYYQKNRWGGLSLRRHKGRLLKVKLDPYGYPQLTLRNGSAHLLHTLVHHLVLSVFGPPRPDGWTADHINGDRADNRISNLRWLTRRDNLRNRHVLNNKSGYMGVSINSKGGPNPFWASARDKTGRKTFLGMYPTAEEAHEAYKIFREEQFTYA